MEEVLLLGAVFVEADEALVEESLGFLSEESDLLFAVATGDLEDLEELK